jgi:hypothetical protein
MRCCGRLIGGRGPIPPPALPLELLPDTVAQLFGDCLGHGPVAQLRHDPREARRPVHLRLAGPVWLPDVRELRALRKVGDDRPRGLSAREVLCRPVLPVLVRRAVPADNIEAASAANYCMHCCDHAVNGRRWQPQ